MKLIIQNGLIVNRGKAEKGHILIEGEKIIDVLFEPLPQDLTANTETIDASGKYVLPGVIDDQVHFREPGLTHKADIHSESKAAVAGGITTFMEMPNTVPQTLTQKLLAEKYDIGARSSVANYSFYMGASNENIDEVLATDPKHVCGLKIFMGSSTGNMLVDNEETLKNIFSKTKMLIATHCEEESIVRANTQKYKEEYGDNIPIEYHPIIRSVEACYASSSKAVRLAKQYDARLHILHISTAKEIELFQAGPLENKRITSEACVHHLTFSDQDYNEKGTFIKWNPAVKTQSDQDQIWQALLNDQIDVLATDHAPHTLEEKKQVYTKAPSGGPLVQHYLPAMLQHVKSGKISLEKMVEKMCHAPAKCFHVQSRGFIDKGYYADLVIVDPNSPWQVNSSNILYKCGWSPFEGTTFDHKIEKTIVNGRVIYSDGKIEEKYKGMALEFSR